VILRFWFIFVVLCIFSLNLESQSSYFLWVFLFVGSYVFVVGRSGFSVTFMGMFSQDAETKAKNMEDEIGRLHKTLEERNAKLQDSASTAGKVSFISQSFYSVSFIKF
jgi:hypothetical protein